MIDAKKTEKRFEGDNEIVKDGSFGVAAYQDGIDRIEDKNANRKEEDFIKFPFGRFEYGEKKQDKEKDGAYFVNVLKTYQVIEYDYEYEGEC